ncbi:MAG: single-stranded-DNA-specific exonuclease RecJ [Angelakisella sp.]|nr:single-stranded-DNA-specific exonuclease RecJ [Angelakisella sp.]
MNFIDWKWPQSLSESVELGVVPKFIQQILSNRGCNSKEEIEWFLDCQYSFHDPFLMADMKQAVCRIHQAINQVEKILIFGDYDCDGVTSTVMLYDYLENCGADILYYIPEREEEGYGLNKASLDRIKAAGVSLIITVDNGISAIAEAEYATQLGLDLIITDHHQPKASLPKACAVIDPHRTDCSYPFKDLCGAGVAFKLLCALEDGDSEMLLEQYGDLLAIATLADVVPLTGENRILAKAGLAGLAQTQREGLLALANVASLNYQEQNAETVTFGIAPRINVSGRIASVDLAVELLLCTDEERAQELAAELNELNVQRKEIEEEIWTDIDRVFAEQPKLLHQRIIVVKGDNWHCGVIGIIAARVVERYRKPCIVLSQDKSEIRGSARSVEGFSMIEAISACGDFLTKYGGHPMAAGLSMETQQLSKFTETLLAYAEKHYPTMPVYSLSVDAVIEADDVTIENCELLSKLSPFGCCNPQPVLTLMGAVLDGITPIGNGNHLRLSLQQKGRQVQAVLFGIGPNQFPFAQGDVIDCAVNLSVNTYHDLRRPSVRILSIHPSGANLSQKQLMKDAYDQIKRGETIGALPFNLSFDREALSVVYRYLRSNSPCLFGEDGVWYKLGNSSDYFKILASLDVLKELNLISDQREKGKRIITVIPSQQKMDLMASPTYQTLTNLKLVH